jgi:hypothetical protein
MKSLLAFGLLGVGIAACGGSSSSNNAAPASHISSGGPTAGPAASSSSAAPSVTTTHLADPNLPPPQPSQRDRERLDRDEDDYIHAPEDHNKTDPPGYVLASPADTRAITALVKRYYAAALAEDGARGCSMFPPSFTKGIPLDYGKLGPSYLKRAAGTCPAVMSLFFKHEHRQLASEVPQLEVVRASINGTQVSVILRFGRLRERFISVLREGNVWRIAGLLDGELE